MTSEPIQNCEAYKRYDPSEKYLTEYKYNGPNVFSVLFNRIDRIGFVDRGYKANINLVRKITISCHV